MEQVRNRWSYTSIQMHMLSHSRVPVDEQQRILDHPKDLYGDHRHVFDAHGGPRVVAKIVQGWPKLRYLAQHIDSTTLLEP